MISPDRWEVVLHPARPSAPTPVTPTVTRPRWAVPLVLALLGSILAAAPGTPAGSQESPPPDWFRPGAPFDWQFPDPSVTPVGPYSIAYSTVQGGAHLPAMWSTDQTTWTARAEEPNLDGSCPDPYENDALLHPGFGMSVAEPSLDNGCTSKELWAPSIEFLGSSWVAFVSARVEGERFCIFRATAPSPFGPFTPSSSRPFHCDTDPNGSIDPDVFVDLDGTPYLLWKSEGIIGSTPTRLWIRQLNSSGSGWARGSTPRVLLQTDRAWEMSDPSRQRGVVENPSMVRYRGRYLLFYSGNEWRSADYGQGYAVCAGPAGPCAKRTLHGPLPGIAGVGAGGGDAFVDERGRLLLAHTHHVGGPPAEGGRRVLRVAELDLSRDGVVVRASVRDGGAGPDYLWSYDGGEYRSSNQSVRGTYTPVAGRFGPDDADDILWYGTAGAGDVLWLHTPGRARDSAAVDQDGSYLPLSGDFDGDGDDDILWYAPGRDPSHPSVPPYGDEYWWSSGNGTHTTEGVRVDGFYLPLVGDFDGNGADDVLWYAPGPTPDRLWLHQPGGDVVQRTRTVNGFYQYPQVGDFDGNGADDILWYAPGQAGDYIWFSDQGGDGYTSRPRTADGVYVPMTGDFDGNGVDDIVWYGPGASADYEWTFSPGGDHRSRPRTVNGHYTTIVGDFDGNGSDDIFWYS